MNAFDKGTPEAPTLRDETQENALFAALEACREGVVVAYSGGVDSTYVLWASLRVLGPERVRAVLGVSAATPAFQIERAREVATALRARLEEVPTNELDDPRYRANAGDRCFFCKDELYAVVGTLTRDERRPILDGTNADDVGGHRPGHAAAGARGVRSPLLEHGIGKDAVRRLSRRAGLPTADQPSSPCLASRFPAGVPVTEEALRRVEAAEVVVRGFGLREFRVRHHGDVARLEVVAEDLPRVFDVPTRAEIDRRLRSLGYRFVSVDLAPFQSGRGSVLPAPPPPSFGV